MKLELKRIADKGVLLKERIVLRATSACNVGAFAIMRTGISDGVVNTGVTATFWFPDAEVQADDVIVVYSKAGSNFSKNVVPERTSHFFYWGLEGPQWDSVDRGVVLLYAPEWQGRIASEL